jgi:hypothetical protein
MFCVLRRRALSSAFAATKRFASTSSSADIQPIGSQLISTINKLQDVVTLSGSKISLNLPQIVVCGSQSAGKSSVIENLGTDRLLYVFVSCCLAYCGMQQHFARNACLWLLTSA